MPARFIILLLFPLLWLAGCTSGPAGAGADTTRSDRTILIQGDFPVLANGMSADEVRQKLGEPAEIRPLSSPAGSAETWVYHLEKYLGQTQVVTYQNRPVFSGTFANDAMSGVPDQVYTMVDRKLLVTLHLLMFNGRLTALKTQSKEILDY